MIPIIGTGLSGLVGSRVVEILHKIYVFQDLSHETGYNICNYSQIEEAIQGSTSQWVFHFAAYTDVQGAEKEKDLGVDSQSWKINVAATDNIALLCKKYTKKVLYISTDYVFDGTKAQYQEDDETNPISFYGKTKLEGEKRILSSGADALIIRIANPYRGNPVGKKDFVHKIRDRLQESLPISAPSDQSFVPTFIDDVAYAIDFLVKGNYMGIYHVVGKSAISPYDAASTIAKIYGLNEALVTKTTYDTYFSGKAKPPKQAALKHDKIDKLGITLHTFEDGIKEVQKQEIDPHKTKV